MKRFLKIAAAGLFILTATGCQREWLSIKKGVQTSERNYEIYVYSGGQIVFEDKFTGILNDSNGSDGIYYYKDGKLIEISGDYIVKSN